MDPLIRTIVLHAREARMGGVTAGDMLDAVQEHASLNGLALSFEDAVDCVELFQEGDEG